MAKNQVAPFLPDTVYNHAIPHRKDYKSTQNVKKHIIAPSSYTFLK